MILEIVLQPLQFHEVQIHLVPRFPFDESHPREEVRHNHIVRNRNVDLALNVEIELAVEFNEMGRTLEPLGIAIGVGTGKHQPIGSVVDGDQGHVSRGIRVCLPPVPDQLLTEDGIAPFVKRIDRSHAAR